MTAPDTTSSAYASLDLFQPPTSERALFETALTEAVTKIEALVPRFGLRNPRVSRPGSRRYGFCGADDWVAGFWPGQLWLAHALTGRPELRRSASMRRPYFRRVLDTPAWHDHDLGFLFSLTAIAEHRLTGSEEARAMGLRAADFLAARWRDPIPALVCWNPNERDTPDLARRKPGTMIIDSIQNTALLFWSAREGGRPAHEAIARAHLDACLRYLVREDASTFHCFEFDPATGEPVGGFTHQGAGDGSCWARGQAWAIHGFAQAYRTTGERCYRDASAQLADYVAERLPASGVPPWDYGEPDGAPPDSSAGAITAAGLYLLAEAFAGNEAQVERYTALGDRMLAGLVRECAIAADPDSEGLMGSGAAFVGIGLSDVMLPYGDYYYLEALMRALGHTEFFW